MRTVTGFRINNVFRTWLPLATYAMNRLLRLVFARVYSTATLRGSLMNLVLY